MYPEAVPVTLCHALLAGSGTRGCLYCCRLLWGQAQTRVCSWKSAWGAEKPPRNMHLQALVCRSSSQAVATLCHRVSWEEMLLGSAPVSRHEKGMVSPLLWSSWCREPGVAAGIGARDVPWSQPQQLAPALVLRAFLRALCSMVLNPPLPLVQASSLINSVLRQMYFTGFC